MYEDQDQTSEEYEVAPQAVDNDGSMHSEEDSNVEAVKQADEQERNWRAVRQRQRELEFELKQKNEMIDKFLNQSKQQNIAPIVEEEEADDDYVPAGKVKGIARRTVQPLEKKIADLEAKIAQQEQQKLLNSLKTQFVDFDDIVNVETLEMLEKHEPELASTIAQLTDPYKMGLQSYKYIKALGLVDKLPNARRSKEVVQKMEKNAKAVQSPQAYDKRPIAQAYKSIQADKTKVYEEMMHYARQANGL